MSTTRSLLRWMCRPLTEVAFLRLVIEQIENEERPERERKPLPYTLAYAFDRLHADAEHPEVDRAEARRLLADALSAERPTLCFARTLRLVREWSPHEDLHDVAGYAALPELLDDGAEPGPVKGYHEIHAHLRGSVPWPCLWVGWLCDERWRGRQRKHPSKHDGWERTHAELLERAATLRATLDLYDRPSVDGVDAELIGVLAERERQWWRRLAVYLVTNEGETADHAAAYLAILAHLRRASLFRRGSAGGEVGLAPFVRAYDRYAGSQKRGRSEANERRAQVGQILDRFQRDGAVSVELRPTFENTPGQMRRRLLDLVEGYLGWLATTSGPPVALGLVPSLFKQDFFLPKAALDALGELEAAAARAARWEEQVTALTEILEDEPILRWFVVGLDGAGAERGCPVRAFAPAYAVLDRYHRRHGVGGRRPGVEIPLDQIQESAQRFDTDGIDVLRDLWPGWPRLGKTMHAGEDFVDSLTGLRHIDEALDHLALGPGDRIGHAIAASLDPTSLCELLRWRARHPEQTGVRALGEDRWLVRVPRGERLLDLAWAAARLEETSVVPRRDLGEVSTRVWLGAQPVLAQGLGLPDPRPALAGLHYGPTQLPASQVFEEVEIGTADLDLREALRERVLQRLVAARVTIESCPTSNLTVADLKEAPLSRLVKRSGLRVAIATDDPALFECFPAREVARVPDMEQRRRVIARAEEASWVRTR